MKTTQILILFFALLAQGLRGQNTFSAGMGYTGEGVKAHGIVLELEKSMVFTTGLSSPLRLDVRFLADENYYATSIDIHKGFRMQFRSGVVLEQAIGLGYAVKTYRTDSYWYIDEYAFSVAHGGRPVGGFMPSVTFGAGYNLSQEQGKLDLFWVRPKVYWDLGMRGLIAPYFSMQIGYTHSFKTK